MLSHPKPGQAVRLHYRRSVAPEMPHHGRQGVVVVAGRRRPRNHLVKLEPCNTLVVVPAGNLRAEA